MNPSTRMEKIPASDFKGLFPGIDLFNRSYQVNLAVHKVLYTRRPMRVSRWAEKHRVVRMSSLPGPWRNEVTPYIAGIMDAAAFSSVEDINVCKAPQTGGSEGVNTFIGYAADRMPGPVLYIFPDQITAKENSQDRIQTMFEDSPRLAEYVTGAEDDMASFRINLVHMPIYMAWANSAARLANKPIRHLVFEETDKYPDTANKREAGPIALGEKRTITYRGRRKRWKISTPTIETGVIWVALTKESEVIFDYLVKCPFCHKQQLMVFDQIKFPEDERDPKVIVSKSLARYECPHCRTLWTDADRDRAARAGTWRARAEDWKPEAPKHGLTLMRHLIKYRPKAIGFHLPSWVSRFVSLSEVAAAFLKGQEDKIALRDFMNAHKAEPWKDKTIPHRVDVILALRDDRPSGVVPGGGVVAGLTAAVDTQDNGFYYQIRAWGWGHLQESWQVSDGFLHADWDKIDPKILKGRQWQYHPAFDALRKVLWEYDYRDAAGNKYIVHFTVMDAMGHKTTEVYDFCRMHVGEIIAFQGVDRMNQPYAYTNIDRYPGTQKAIPGGVLLLRGNVTYYKNRLSGKLAVKPADPGAWHLHKDVSTEMARQMTAEYINEKTGLWTCQSGRPNHAWDCSVYNLVAADVIHLKQWAKPAEDPTAKADKPQVLRSRWMER